MAKKVITDRSLFLGGNGYGSFGACTILNHGRFIRFRMRNGINYDVPIEYFLQWYDSPHYVKVKGKWTDFKRDKVKSLMVKGLRFSRVRRTSDNHCLWVYLNNHTSYLTVWDTVLMACEKDYEHFGGLTPRSKRITKSWFRKVKLLPPQPAQ